MEDKGQTSAVCIRLPYGVGSKENLDPLFPKTPMDDAVGNQRHKKKKWSNFKFAHNNHKKPDQEKKARIRNLENE